MPQIDPVNIIAIDRKGYPLYIFHISPRKRVVGSHMLWVLTRSALPKKRFTKALLLSTHNYVFVAK